MSISIEGYQIAFLAWSVFKVGANVATDPKNATSLSRWSWAYAALTVLLACGALAQLQSP